MKSLEEFTEEWKQWYQKKSREIELFTRENFSDRQTRYFVRVFWHARGHFYRFLWIVASRATSQEAKKEVLENMAEEFGHEYPASHEEYYLRFAEQMGVDRETLTVEEKINENNYRPYIEQFNRGHTQWLLKHGPEGRWAAFSAYELLDNVDYKKLGEFAERMGAEDEGLRFFDVHVDVDHFEATEGLLQEYWSSNPKAVKKGFKFIGRHNLRLWQNLSDDVLSR